MSSKQWSDMSDEQRDEWLASVGMWYVANWDEATDEKGFAKPLGRMLGRGIGGRAPRAGRGGGDIDPLGGRDLEDVVDRNRDGWVFSGRWRRRAAAPNVAGRDESAKPKTPGRALRALPSVDRRARKPKGAPEKVTDVFTPRRQDGLSRVNRRYQAVVGRVMNRFDDEQLILPGSHGERHVAMLEAVDAAPSRAAAKEVIADRINEIDKRIDVLNKMLDKRRVNRRAKERHLDEMMSLLKEREWSLHRQGQLAALPDKRPEFLESQFAWPAWSKQTFPYDRDISARERAIKAAVREALDSEKPDRQNARYLAKIRDRYEGQAGTSERVSSIRSEIKGVREELDNLTERWLQDATPEQDKSRAEAIASRRRLIEALYRDENAALAALDRRRQRVQFTGAGAQTKFKPIDMEKNDSYLLPDNLQGLDIEDVFRQQLGDAFDDPFEYPLNLGTDYRSERDSTLLARRIMGLSESQVDLEEKLRDTGELTASERERYRYVLRELDVARERSRELAAERLRWSGQSDSAFGADRDGTPLEQADIAKIFGGEEVIEQVAVNQRDADDWDEIDLTAEEVITPAAKDMLEGKVVSFDEDGTTRGGVIVQVRPFDRDIAIEDYDEYAEESAPAWGGDIALWVTHENGKLLDEPYEYTITAKYGDAEAAVDTMRIHGKSKAPANTDADELARIDRRVEADLDARDD